MAVRARRSSGFLFALVAPAALWVWLAGAAGCVVGEEEAPGCRQDSECEEGFVCRAGACLRVTTGLSPPRDPEDAGQDEAGDGGLVDGD